MGRQIAWLVAVLALVAVGGALSRRPTPPVREDFAMELTLAARPDAPGYTLRVSAPVEGPVTWTRHLDTVTDARGNLTREQWQQWREDLEQEGLWTIPDGAEPEGNGVLYTQLAAREGSREHHSAWVGLPSSAHQALAQALLHGPLSQEIGTGLEMVRGLKGSGDRS